MLPKYHNDLIPKCMRTRMIDDIKTQEIKDTICPTCGGYCAKNGEFYYCHEEHCKQLPFKNKIRWCRTIDLKTGKSKKVKIYEGRHF